MSSQHPDPFKFPENPELARKRVRSAARRGVVTGAAVALATVAVASQLIPLSSSSASDQAPGPFGPGAAPLSAAAFGCDGAASSETAASTVAVLREIEALTRAIAEIRATLPRPRRDLVITPRDLESFR